MIAIETGVKINNNILRTDMVVYGKKGQPAMVVEFKAPSIKINQNVFNQIVRYNMQLKVKYLVVSNGLSHYCCKIDYENSSYEFLKDIPDFEEIRN